MKTKDSNGCNIEINRNWLTDIEDMQLLSSLVGRTCLVKEHDCQHAYEKINILGFANGIIMFCKVDNAKTVYMNRYDFYKIVMQMPDFESCEAQDRELDGKLSAL